MNAQEATDLLCATIQTVASTNNYSVIWPDTDSQVPAGQSVWLRVKLVHATGDQTSIAPVGNRTWTITGTLFVQVMAPKGDGNVAGNKAVDIILTALRGFQDPVLWLRDTHHVEIGLDGQFNITNVLSTFTYETVA